MMNVKPIGVLIAGIVCGAAGVWLFPSGTEEKATDIRPESGKSARKALIADADTVTRNVQAEEERKMRARIAELEGQLKSAESDLKVAEKTAPNVEKKPLTHDEWFELQRTVNPERYRQLTNGIARTVAKTVTENSARAEMLDTVDLSDLGPEAVAQHAAYRDALRRLADMRRDEAARRFQSPDFKAHNTPEWEAELKSAGKTVAELEPQERFMLLGEAGRMHGLRPKEARELAETMHLIIETTSGSKRFLKSQRESLSASR